MLKQKVLDTLSDIDNFCAYKRKKMFYTVEYDLKASEEDKLMALGAVKAYLDVEEQLLRKIDRIRWNADC